MAAVIIPLFWALLGLAVVFVPGVAQKLEAAIEGVSSSLVKGPINTVTNAWVKVTAIAAVFGVGIWLVETKLAKHEGVEGPRLLAAGAPTPNPPAFNAATGYGIDAGPVQVKSTTGASSGSSAPPPEIIVDSGGGRGGFNDREVRGSKINRTQRRTAKLREETALLREEAYNRTARQTLSGFSEKRKAA